MTEQPQIAPVNFPPLFDRLKIVRECPLCLTSYSGNELKILEDDGDGHLVHIKCPNCQSAILALVVSSQIGMSTIGIVTDLTAEEVSKIKNQAPVSEEELLNFHEFISKKNSSIFNN